MAKFIKPFRTGDMVRIARLPKDPTTTGWDDEPDMRARKEDKKAIGEEHIIHKIMIDGYNQYLYATDRSAWHEHGIFDLVRECDEYSMKALVKALEDEEAEGDDGDD